MWKNYNQVEISKKCFKIIDFKSNLCWLSLTYIFFCRIVAAFSIHSYGNVMIFPWGYANIKHENEDKMSELAYKMVNDIKWRTSDRELYVPGTAYQVLIYLSRLTPSILLRYLIDGALQVVLQMIGTALLVFLTHTLGSFQRGMKMGFMVLSCHQRTSLEYFAASILSPNFLLFRLGSIYL